jgi:hypothetical protein
MAFDQTVHFAAASVRVTDVGDVADFRNLSQIAEQPASLACSVADFEFSMRRARE